MSRLVVNLEFWSISYNRVKEGGVFLERCFGGFESILLGIVFLRGLVGVLRFLRFVMVCC